MGSLPHSEVKISIVDSLRDRSVGRCPILRSVRQPHAAQQSERTNNNTVWMSVCIVRGQKCVIGVSWEVTGFNPRKLYV